MKHSRLVAALLLAFASILPIGLGGGAADASTSNCDAASVEQPYGDGIGWQSLAYKVGYTPQVWSIMTKLCGRESGGVVDANTPRGGTKYDHGLLQIHCVPGDAQSWCARAGVTIADLDNPRINLAMGLFILCDRWGGWRAWSKRGGRVCLDIRWDGPLIADVVIPAVFLHDLAVRI